MKANNKSKASKKNFLTNEDFEALKKILGKYGIYIVLVIMVIVMSILLPGIFFTKGNFLNIIRSVSIIGLIALGVTFVIISKGIDLSGGSVVALAAVVGASFAQTVEFAGRMYPTLAELPIYVPIMAALVVGLIVGIINGSLIAYTGIPAFISTLGAYASVRGLAQLYSNNRPVSKLTESYMFIGQGDILGIPCPIIIFALMAIISWIMLSHTKFGKNVYAIGGNVTAAEVSGINVKKNLIKIYAYAGLLSGLAGLIISSRVGSGQSSMGVAYELDAIAAATIGGTSHSGGIGTIQGTLVGTLILGVLSNGLDLLGVSSDWQQVVKGGIIVCAVVFDMRKNVKKK